MSERKALVEFPPRLLRGCLRRIWIQYFIRDFGILTLYFLVGILFTLFGTIFGSYYWIRNAQLNILTPTGTVMVAVLPIILGIQFLLQAISLDIQNAPRHPIQEEEQFASLRRSDGARLPTSGVNEEGDPNKEPEAPGRET